MLASFGRVSAIRDEFGRHIGLSGIQYTILISIYYLSKKQLPNVKALADHLHLSGAFVTLETGKLAKMGLITKQKDPLDGRCVRIRVTKEGRELLVRLCPLQQAVNDVLFGDLDRQDFLDVSQMLQRMVSNGDAAISMVDYLMKISVR